MATVFRTAVGADVGTTRRSHGQQIVRVITSTDHKVIGKLYLTTSFAWFLAAGVEGMPRRYADYLPQDGFTTLNQISTADAFLLAASTFPFLYNVRISRNAPLVEVDDPWGWGRSLEWATSCPPPRHNFESIPRIRSESPAFDLHHPEVAAMEMEQNESLGETNVVDAPSVDGREDHLREQMEEGESRGPDRD